MLRSYEKLWAADVTRVLEPALDAYDPSSLPFPARPWNVTMLYAAAGTAAAESRLSTSRLFWVATTALTRKTLPVPLMYRFRSSAAARSAPVWASTKSSQVGPSVGTTTRHASAGAPRSTSTTSAGASGDIWSSTGLSTPTALSAIFSAVAALTLGFGSTSRSGTTLLFTPMTSPAALTCTLTSAPWTGTPRCVWAKVKCLPIRLSRPAAFASSTATAPRRPKSSARSKRKRRASPVEVAGRRTPSAPWSVCAVPKRLQRTAIGAVAPRWRASSAAVASDVASDSGVSACPTTPVDFSGPASSAQPARAIKDCGAS